MQSKFTFDPSCAHRQVRIHVSCDPQMDLPSQICTFLIFLIPVKFYDHCQNAIKTAALICSIGHEYTLPCVTNPRYGLYLNFCQSNQWNMENIFISIPLIIREMDHFDIYWLCFFLWDLNLLLLSKSCFFSLTCVNSLNIMAITLFLLYVWQIFSPDLWLVYSVFH